VNNLFQDMRRPSLLKKKPTDTTQAETVQVIEYALEPAVTVEDNPNGQDRLDGPPEGGYGWVVVGAVSLINGFTWGVAAVSLYLFNHHQTKINL
jgi:hypothetical protein